MTEEPVTIPVVYVGDEDVAKHIKGPRSKSTRKSTRATLGISSTFVEASIEDAPKKPASKKPDKPVEEIYDPLAALRGSEELIDVETGHTGSQVFAFKTPKRSKQMNKYAESVKKKQVENVVQSLAEPDSVNGVVTKKQYSVQLVQDQNEAITSDEDSKSESDEEMETNTEQEIDPSIGSTKKSHGLQLPSERELYFDVHGGGSKRKQLSNTSDRTLQRLKNPQMNPKQLEEALNKHKKVVEKNTAAQEVEAAQIKLCEQHKKHFVKWMFYLCNNFNILLYGLGSKRNLMHSFCDKMLSSQDKVVINGFFPGLSIKSVLTSICEDILEDVASFTNVEVQTDRICQHYTSDENKEHLFLIVHNIDGSCLRNARSQSIFGRLALVERIHIVASIDHINAPLIWDQISLSRFNWLWYDVTTFEPYREETSYEGSLLLSGAGAGLGARGAALALSGLLHVARSLTSNARGVFRILAEHHLSEIEEKKDQGSVDDFSFADLYQKCRERFLVNSELTLRAHLTEFLDHHLVQMRKGPDGAEYLSVPLDPTTLTEYLEKDESM